MTRSTWFWVASVCGLIFLVFAVSVLINGFSTVQLAVLLVPLALYALAVKDFGEGSVIEMGVPAIIIALLLAMSIPIYHRWQERRNRPATPIHKVAQNAPKAAVNPVPR